MDEDRDAWRLQMEELYNTDNMLDVLGILTPGRTPVLNVSLQEIFGLGRGDDDDVGEDDELRQEMEELRNLEAAYQLQDELEILNREGRPARSFMDQILRMMLPSLTSAISSAPSEEREISRQRTAARRRQEEAARRRQEEAARRIQEEAARRRQEEANRRRMEEASSSFLRLLGGFLNAFLTSRIPTMSRAELNDLPTAHHSGDASGKSEPSPAQCSICLVDYQRGDEKRILPCAHNFHKECADQWLVINATCPVCRCRVH